MKTLLAISRLIDAATGTLGRAVSWLIVTAAVVSAGNAVVRKAFDLSSNSWLDLQWWLFAAVFLLAAPWTLKDNDHVRIDIVNALLPRRARDVIELAGHVFFLIPTAAMILATSWLYFLTSYEENEQAFNAGGLPQWPIKALIPAAFALLLLQGFSELIKRIAIMRGLIPETAQGGGFHGAAAGAAILAPPGSDRTGGADRP
jgi:TRAP-type mannitol/chloroaromatic compound transport system permease small subunit